MEATSTKPPLHPSSPPRTAKRRKVTRACDRCKFRKRRCNAFETSANPGTHRFSSVCVANAAECKYEAAYTRGKAVEPLPSSTAEAPVVHQNRCIDQVILESSHDISDELVSEEAGEYAESSSAYAFLKRAWQRFGHREGLGTNNQQATAGQTASIFAFGDRRLRPVQNALAKLPPLRESQALLALYFGFAMPCFRYLHQPSACGWLVAMQNEPPGNSCSAPQQAIVWMVLASATIFRIEEPLATSEELAEPYYIAAVQALSRETGRARLESIQSRLAISIYLLHTGRPNEAWHNLGMTVQLTLGLGLHRSRAGQASESVLVQELVKRTFWAVATLDTYMSIMLGRPALLHDADIGQRYPQALDDEQICEGPQIDMVGDRVITGSILHAKLARIAKRAAQAQSSICAQTDQQRLEAASKVTKELEAWQQSLPVILSGAVHPSSLIPIFRRQTMVLALAHAHAIMLVTRPLLLVESLAAQIHVVDCVNAANSTLQMLTGPKSEGTIFATFWFTQYVAFNAVSIAYIWLIQRKRGRWAGLHVMFSDERLLEEAEVVQRHFEEALEMNAPSLRYHVVLEELRQELKRSSTRGQTRTRMDGVQQASNIEPPCPPGSVVVKVDATALGCPLSTESDLSFEDFEHDFAFEPDLWLQLDAFPFGKLPLLNVISR
ncbi:hypothetical protein LTR56_021329 [Elasticomyces elasticus]|nr:hypothetical protein LTR56_021329 [Elasticomyces elasticus]KAK3631670.1 hypothetical protein LTR22_020960 [Elasticomyces elasticus]KAK4909571.1 hypothetical protein LTR49_021688 [Elasticomyces elasticus]KAK5737844.1 hypothetical protein LTS12_025782 [Elasticomyces elasticus]